MGTDLSRLIDKESVVLIVLCLKNPGIVKAEYVHEIILGMSVSAIIHVISTKKLRTSFDRDH